MAQPGSTPSPGRRQLAASAGWPSKGNPQDNEPAKGFKTSDCPASMQPAIATAQGPQTLRGWRWPQATSVAQPRVQMYAAAAQASSVHVGMLWGLALAPGPPSRFEDHEASQVRQAGTPGLGWLRRPNSPPCTWSELWKAWPRPGGSCGWHSTEAGAGWGLGSGSRSGVFPDQAYCCLRSRRRNSCWHAKAEPAGCAWPLQEGPPGLLG